MSPLTVALTPVIFDPSPTKPPLELMTPLAVKFVILGDASRLTVTVSVAPTAVVIFVPPAISNVLPSAIVWFEPPSAVSVKSSKEPPPPPPPPVPNAITDTSVEPD